MKFHISPKDNIARKCGASYKCRYGITDENHLTAETAVLHNEKVAQGLNSTVASVKRTKIRGPKVSASEQQAIKDAKRGTTKSRSTIEENLARKAFFNTELNSPARIELLSTSAIPKDVQKIILKDLNINEVKALASNSVINPKILDSFPLWNGGVVDALIRNKNSSLELLRKIADQKQHAIDLAGLKALVLHGNSDDQVYSKLIGMRGKNEIKILIASQKDASSETLKHLAKASNEEVRLAAIKNEEILTDTLLELSKGDLTAAEIKAVISHPKTNLQMKKNIRETLQKKKEAAEKILQDLN